jgi:hypothetical protein
MIASPRKQGHSDPRYGHLTRERQLVSDHASGVELPAGLDWSAFRTSNFPGRRRHDLEALAAYEAYRSPAALTSGSAVGPG